MLKLFELQVEDENRDIREYKKIDSERYQKLINFAKKIKNKTIIHINATPYGGGVAELLKSQVPLERSLGLKSHWFTIKAPKNFFIVTKKIHNFLQGNPGSLIDKEKGIYINTNHQFGENLIAILKTVKNGLIVIHDFHLLPLIHFIPPKFSVILRFHLDLITPNQIILDFLQPFIKKYDSIILSSKDYQLPFSWLPTKKIKIIQPAIDPLSKKNKTMNLITAQRILEEFDINYTKPILTQVSRFDRWKDPLGVIQVYYLVKKEIPQLQLVLAGLFSAQDDPEAFPIFKKVKKHTLGDRNIHLFFYPKDLKNFSNDIFVNSLYTASTVIIQKSLREGFGLTITEAMWKEKVVVAGKTSGTSLQIRDGKNGFLILFPEEAAKIIARVIKDKKLNERIGKAARRSVKQKFLFPRFLLDNLKLYYRI